MRDAADDMGALARGTVVGRYTIEGVLGTGGMGVVYAARDPELQRDIAIKILRRDGDSADLAAQTRILREAQALARLDHPNIVAIHDVGSIDDQIFVAMQLVGGCSLAEWMRAAPRSWREVRDVFLAAGRGLMAAHAVGIVHRDFKPQNVMVDGARVVVLDFSLARQGDEAALTTVEPTSFDVGVTTTGDLIGTPAYMAPEQLDGAPATERSDQWSFCVSLYEALYGERPFLGDTVVALAEAARSGAPSLLPRRPQVPRWLAALVRRGLRVNPDERHPSMAALVAALDRAPRWRRRLVVAGAVGLLGALALTVGLRPESRPCAGAATALADVWDGTARERMRSAFTATGRGFAAETFTRTAAVLDEHAAAWTAMREEACAATLVRGEQSASLMDARMACLDRRRHELGALVQALSQDVTPATVGAAVDAARALTAVDRCADRDALAARVPLPDDPEARRTHDALAARLDEVAALIATGKTSAAIAFTGDIERAAHSPHAPLRARALLLRAALRKLAGQIREVRPLVEAALEAAVAGRDDDLAAAAWLDLVEARMNEGAYAEAVELELAARTALTRAGDRPEWRIRLEAAVGEALARSGRYDEASARFEQAIALARTLGPTNGTLGLVLFKSAQVYEMRRDNERWRRRAEEAVLAVEAAWGPDHFKVIQPLGALATAETELGRLDEAAALYRRAFKVAEASIGLDSREAATLVINQGLLEGKQRHTEQAVALYERGLGILEQRLGHDHPDLTPVLLNLGDAYLTLDRRQDARATLDRARRIAEASLPADHPRFSVVHNGYYQLASVEGHWEEALEHARSGLAILEKKVPPTSARLLPAITRVGEASAELHRFPESLAMYERAFMIVEANKVSPATAAQVRWTLAQSIVLAGGDRQRARRLASEAEHVFGELGDAARRQRVHTWLATHGKP